MVIIEIRVIPNAKQEKIILDKNLTIKCYVASPAQDGRANKAIINIFSQKLNLSKSVIHIVSGLISKNKKLEIGSLDTINQVYKLLNFEIQNSLIKK